MVLYVDIDALLAYLSKFKQYIVVLNSEDCDTALCYKDIGILHYASKFDFTTSVLTAKRISSNTIYSSKDIVIGTSKGVNIVYTCKFEEWSFMKMLGWCVSQGCDYFIAGTVCHFL